MSASILLQDWLRDVGERSLFTVRSHVAAETTADTDRICATVSRDVFFAVPHRTREGNAIAPGTVLTSHEAVRDYYAGRAGAYVVLDSRQLKSTARDWYVFNESAATLRGTGPIGAVDATGREFVVNSAVLFPTASDGIRGEICVTRHPFDDVVRGTAPALPALDPSFPERERQHAILLDRLLEALRDDDLSAIVGLLSVGHTFATRLDARARPPGTAAANGSAAADGGGTRVETGGGREAAGKALAAIFGPMQDVALATRFATDWYVFAEYVGRLESTEIRRFAAIHPIEDGEITGTFGYGRDEAVA